MTKSFFCRIREKKVIEQLNNEKEKITTVNE